MILLSYGAAGAVFGLAIVSGAVWFAGILYVQAGHIAGSSADIAHATGAFLLSLAPLLLLAGSRHIVLEVRAQLWEKSTSVDAG